jgi:predicted N-acyltransferase
VTDTGADSGARVRTVASVTRVDSAGWDRLAASNPLLSHGWLRVTEEEGSEEIERVYFLLETGGRLAGAAACCLETPAGRAESVDDLLLGRLRSTALGRVLSFRPSLVCGFPWSVGSGLLVDPDAEAPRRHQLARLLVEAITRESSVRGCATAFMSVAESESSLRDALVASGYEFVRHAPVYNLDLRWGSFDAYRRGLPSDNIRQNIRKQLNRNCKLGVEIRELEDPRGLEERLHELVDRHFHRFGWSASPYGRSWFRTLKARLGSDAVIAVAMRGETVLGVTVALRKEKTFQSVIACVDHEASGNDMTHFNLAYYWPVREGIARGDRSHVAGPGQAVARLRRGYRPLENYIYYRSANPTRRIVCRLWFRLLSYRLGRKRNSIEL